MAKQDYSVYTPRIFLRRPTVAALAKALNITGIAAQLYRGFSLAAGGVSYSVTAAAAGLLKTWLLIAAGTSYTVGGVAAGLNLGKTLTGEATSYVISGAAASLFRTYALLAETVSFGISGTAAQLRKTWLLIAGGTSYTISATAASLCRGFSVLADAESYLVTAADSALSKISQLAADPVSVLVTVQNAALNRGKTLAADKTGYTLTPTDADFLRGLLADAGVGSMLLTPQTAGTNRGRRASAGVAAFSINGQAATLDLQSYTETEAVNFDGSSGYGSFTNTVTGSGQAFTIVAWVNPDTIPSLSFGDTKAFVELGNIHLGLFNSATLGGVLGIALHVPSQAIVYPTAGAGNISAGVRQMVAGTHAGGAMSTSNSKVYVDAAQLTTSISGSSTPNPTSTGHIARRTTTATHYFDGTIGWVAIWNSELTASEIAALYNSGTPTDPRSDFGNYASSADLQHFFPMEEGSGATIDDTEQAANGSLSGTYSWLTW